MQKTLTIRFVVILTVVIVCAFFFLSPFRSKLVKEESFTVRVRLVHDAKELELAGKGACRVTDPETGTILAKNIALAKGAKVLSTASGIELGGQLFDAAVIRMSPIGKDGLTLNGTDYRGQMDIIKTKAGLNAINRVELEDYLKGVLPKEVSSLWPFEALKAQAIASRSFAVERTLRRKSQDYDLTADTYSQVYGGQSCEKWRPSKAVDVTNGKVLEYNGKVLPAYFHSCCGGHTQDASRLWGAGKDPLKGVKCPWCRWSPHFRWRVRVPTKTIVEKLDQRGYNIARIDDIKEGPRDDSGRLEYVRIRSRNKWFEIDIKDFLTALSRQVLRSSNFRVKKYPRFYLFSGYGWGHGAGMCQWGAFGLSLRWRKANSILKIYYPGAKIVNLEKVLNKNET